MKYFYGAIGTFFMVGVATCIGDENYIGFAVTFVISIVGFGMMEWHHARENR